MHVPEQGEGAGRERIKREVSRQRQSYWESGDTISQNSTYRSRFWKLEVLTDLVVDIWKWEVPVGHTGRNIQQIDKWFWGLKA